MKRRSLRAVPSAMLAGALALTLAGCGPTTPTSKVRDAAQSMVTQLPNSSAKESAQTWLHDFNKKGQTRDGEGNIIGPSWHYGPWADFGVGGGSAYSVTVAGSHVLLDIALMRIGPGTAGLTASACTCLRVTLSPGRHADMTDLSCPEDVRDRASAVARYTSSITLDEDLHADAKG